MALDARPREGTLAGSTVTLWVRSDAPPVARERARRVRDRLAGRPVTTVTEYWPSRIALDANGPLAATFERFEAWADRAGVSLEPAFRHTTFDCAITGDCDERLVTPVCCLSVERDGRVTAVYPHREGERVVGVEEGLERVLERLP